MIMSVSMLIIFSGAATPSSLSNFCIVSVPVNAFFRALFRPVFKASGRAGVAQSACLRKRSALLLELADAVEGSDPAARRAPPDLPLGRQLVALLEHSDAHDVERLPALAGRGRVERSAAGRAERL